MNAFPYLVRQEGREHLNCDKIAGQPYLPDGPIKCSECGEDPHFVGQLSDPRRYFPQTLQIFYCETHGYLVRRLEYGTEPHYGEPGLTYQVVRWLRTTQTGPGFHFFERGLWLTDLGDLPQVWIDYDLRLFYPAQKSISS